ncbi:hypothetical protein MMC10_006630 [Thelotrema lepadinum]|nr:hypothetical protein [Thelotrema lepadinum]
MAQPSEISKAIDVAAVSLLSRISFLFKWKSSSTLEAGNDCEKYTRAGDQSYVYVNPKSAVARKKPRAAPILSHEEDLQKKAQDFITAATEMDFVKVMANEDGDITFTEPYEELTMPEPK